MKKLKKIRPAAGVLLRVTQLFAARLAVVTLIAAALIFSGCGGKKDTGGGDL
jgi:hypothetical protein